MKYLIICLAMISILPVMASQITLDTDKSMYIQGDMVSITGNAGQSAGQLVAIEAKDANSQSILLRTVQTDSSGNFMLQFKIPQSASLPINIIATSTIDGAMSTTSKQLQSSTSQPNPVSLSDLYVTAIIASDPNDRGILYSSGDTITIRFSQSTNQPPAYTKDEIDNLFTFSQSLGTDYTGKWINPSTLVIDIVDATGATINSKNNFYLTPKADGELKNEQGTSSIVQIPSPPNYGSFETPSTTVSVIDGGTAAVILPSGIISELKLPLGESGQVKIINSKISDDFTSNGKTIKLIGDVADISPIGASCTGGCIISFYFTNDDLPIGASVNDTKIFHDKNDNNNFADSGEALPTTVISTGPHAFRAFTTDTSNSKFAIGVILSQASLANGGLGTTTPKSGCLIATAAFGSELAPQVQQLRETRDNIVLKTGSGAAFMTGFNSFYYTFAPTVADWERENPVFKESVKATITPLITTLSILNYIPIHSDGEMLFYGIGVILLNIGIYFVAPIFGVVKIKNYIRNRK